MILTDRGLRVKLGKRGIWIWQFLTPSQHDGTLALARLNRSGGRNRIPACARYNSRMKRRCWKSDHDEEQFPQSPGRGDPRLNSQKYA